MSSVIGPMKSEDGRSMSMRNDVNNLPVEMCKSHTGRQTFNAHVMVTKMNCLNCTRKCFYESLNFSVFVCVSDW